MKLGMRRPPVDDQVRRELAHNISSCCDIEMIARQAQALTLKHFGRTISLYSPLYLSNYCSGGCIYCGFAADRRQKRLRLSMDEVAEECRAVHAAGIDDILLLTGERTREAGVDYLAGCVEIAAAIFSHVGVESFAMTTEEYARLVNAGCTSVTIYQETYDRRAYSRLHRGGAKKDYINRYEAPDRALSAGMRFVGLGVLLGLSNPVNDVMALYDHAVQLQRDYWRAGVMVSLPRVRPQSGGFIPPHPVTDATLVRFIASLRIALPTVPLVLSTRESAVFRDAMAGVGISRMSVASRTTVGGYAAKSSTGGQFSVHDNRSVKQFIAALSSKNIFPVFKQWDASYRELSVADPAVGRGTR